MAIYMKSAEHSSDVAHAGRHAGDSHPAHVAPVSHADVSEEVGLPLCVALDLSEGGPRVAGALEQGLTRKLVPRTGASSACKTASGEHISTTISI